MKYGGIISKCNPSQTHEELNDLLLELEGFNIQNVLEIGVHLGGSIKVWEEVFKPNILIGIDGQITPEFSKIDGVCKIKGYSQSNETFNKAKEALNGEQLDFLFIDGSHYYNDVKIDFQMYKELVRPGGVIAFHDVILTGNDTCEVYKFWNELVGSGQYKTKTISYKDQFGPSATGCGIVFLN
jgi:predicted O-methyltransferase YrrM